MIRHKCIFMKTRVTITLDPDVHRLAKQTARKKRTSVSALIESLLQAQDTRGSVDIVAEMTGICTLRAPAPGADPLYDALQAKHLRA
jgi:hypothetical protein